MTEPTPQPTLADVLAAIGSLAVKVDGVDAKADTLAGKVDAQGETLAGHTQALSGLKLDFAAHAELAQARHVETTQALEAIAGLAHEQQHALVQAEARLRSRIEDVQGVVQTLKADLAAHTSDPQVHERRATPGGAA